MTTDMQHIESKINGVEQKLDTVGKDIKEMKMVLQGNPFDRTDEGMIGELNALKKKVETLEKFKDRGVYLVLGLSFGAGYGLSDVISKLFT